MNPLVFLLALTSLQIEQENTQLTNDLYRLLKKYAGLRNIIRNLKVSTRAFIKFRRFRIWLKSCLNYRIVLWIRRCTQSFLGTPFLRRWSRRRCAIPTTWRSATRPTVEGDDFYEEWSIARLLGHYASVTWHVCLRHHEWIPRHVTSIIRSLRLFIESIWYATCYAEKWTTVMLTVNLKMC